MRPRQVSELCLNLAWADNFGLRMAFVRLGPTWLRRNTFAPTL